MNFGVGAAVTLAYLVAAVFLCWFEHDFGKLWLLWLAGGIPFCYALYAVFVGAANGLRQFHKQAGLDITFATLRAAGLLGMAMAGLGVVGVVGGWVAAVGVILVLAATWVGLPGAVPTEQRLPVKPMVRYFVGVAIYLALFNALMFVDTWLLKRFTTDYFAARGDADPSALADVQVGYYAAVQNLARLSYQAIIAATFVVFPLVSRSTFTEDRDTTKRYVEITTRYSLAFAAAIAVVMAGEPTEVLGLVYAPDYAQLGGPALALLAIGNVAFSVFAIAGTILNGAGKTGAAIATAAVTLVLAIAGNAIAIPIATGSGHALEAAAGVTAGAMIVGAVLTGLALRRAIGAFVPAASAVRVAIAAGVAIAVGRVLPLHGKLLALVAAAAIGVVFVAVLVATRELGRRDLEVIKAVRAKRGAGGGDV